MRKERRRLAPLERLGPADRTETGGALVWNDDGVGPERRSAGQINRAGGQARSSGAPIGAPLDGARGGEGALRTAGQLQVVCARCTERAACGSRSLIVDVPLEVSARARRWNQRRRGPAAQQGVVS